MTRDNSTGTVDLGVTTDDYKDTGDDVDWASASYSYGDTATSGANTIVEHGLDTADENDDSSFTVTGNYTTSAAGGTISPPTTPPPPNAMMDDPDGYSSCRLMYHFVVAPSTARICSGPLSYGKPHGNGES